MAVWLRRIAGWLLHPFATRERRRTSFAMLVVLIAYGMQYARTQRFHNAPHGDGFFSWMYATSLAYDGDIELTNDYRICGRPELVVDQGGGRPANPFYFGPAMIWAPILLVVRLLVRLPATAPAAWKHACSGPLAQIVGATTPLFTVLTIWLAYRVARRFTSQPYALAGALIGAFGTTLVTYGGPVWFYSHLWSALGVALVILAFVRATEKPELDRRWFLFGLAVAFAALMRPQEGVWVGLGVVWLVAMLREHGPSVATLKRLLRPAVVWTLGFASLYWVQLVVYKKIYGVYWIVPQGKLYLQLGHAHPFLMMFSNYSGWFSWTPLVWLGLFGTVRMLFTRSWRVLGVGLLLAGGLDTYIASSVLSWAGGGTWGMRTMTSLAPAVIIGAAVFSQSLGEWIRRRRDRTRLVLILALVFPLMFATWGTPMIDPATMRQPLTYPYGPAVTQNLADMGKTLGNPFTLPATQVFALRYRLPRTKFDDLAFSGLFVHNYLTAETVSESAIVFATPNQQVAYAEGIAIEKEGARIASGRGRFLFTLYWPWITHIRLAVKLAEPRETTIRLEARGFFLGTDLGSMVYAPGREDLEWTLPKGALDSGINELIVRADGDITLKSLEFIDRTKHDTSLK